MPPPPIADPPRRPPKVASGALLYPKRGFARRLQRIRLHFNDAYSIEIWIWALILFLMTTPFTFALRGQDPTFEMGLNRATMRGEDGSLTVIYIMRLAMLGFAILMSLQRWRVTYRALPRLLPLAAFLGWAVLSIIWSDAPETTMHAAFALVGGVLTAFLLAVRLPPHLAARALIYSGAIMAACSIGEVAVHPAYGMHQANDVAQSVHAGAWRGVYLHKNHFGQLCAMYAAAIFMAGRAVIGSVIVKWSLFGVMIGLIVASTSASAIVVVPTAIFLVWLVVMLNPMQKIFASTAAIAGTIMAILSLNILMAMLGRDPTLTGRTTIWSTAFTYVAAHPLHGYGYASSVYGGFIYELSRMMGVADPHNGLLDLVLGLGFIGLGLFLTAVVTAWVVARAIYLVGGAFGQGMVVLTAPLMAWLVTCMSESNMRPMATVAALGFASLSMVLAFPRARLLTKKLPMPMRTWDAPYG